MNSPCLYWQTCGYLYEVVWIVYVVVMAVKAKEESTRDRNWTEDEMCIFAEVLADSDNGFANGLEMLALKRSSNKETFELIKKCLDIELKYYNNKNEDSKKSKIGLDTSIEKLRVKYRNWLMESEIMKWVVKTYCFTREVLLYP